MIMFNNSSFNCFPFAAITRGLNVQWPPPEFEEQKQIEVEIRQTHLPVKAHGRVWPPPQPGVDENNEPVEYQGNNHFLS